MADPVKPVPPRILVMGIGSSGTNAVARMKSLNPELNAVVLDTDKKILSACGMDPESLLHVGESVTRGFSSGGDVELGRQSITPESSRIRALLQPVNLLIIVTGLGGGTGTGAAPVIARLAREADTPVLCLTTMPFELEGKGIMNKAQEGLKKLRTYADAIVQVPNEMMLEKEEVDIPAEEAFARSQQVLTEAVFALWRLLAHTGIYNLDFACIQILLRHCDGFCHFASVDIAGENRGRTAADQLAGHPMLNKGKALKRAAGIIVGISGGQDLTMGEVQAVMKRLNEKLPDDAWTSIGVAIDPVFDGRLSVIVLVAEQWKEPLMDDERPQLGFSFDNNVSQEQGQLPFAPTKKGSFDNLEPTIHENEDLDVPTYIRRNIKLPR